MNAVEGFDKLLTKFLPEDPTFYSTIENRVRTHLVLGLKCVGYAKFYQRVFEQTGIQEGILMILYIRTEDRMHAWKQLYQRKETV
jgi:hypothetical protein